MAQITFLENKMGKHKDNRSPYLQFGCSACKSVDSILSISVVSGHCIQNVLSLNVVSFGLLDGGIDGRKFSNSGISQILIPTDLVIKSWVNTQ